MKQWGKYIVNTLGAGLLVVVPVYLALLLLLKGMKSLLKVVQPLAKLFPAWFPAEHILSLLLVVGICFLVGVSIRSPRDHLALERMEKSLFGKIPGYALIHSLTQRLAGKSEDNTWKPALAEIEEALVPAFIAEELEDGRFTVFVPSVPTPLAGSIYILTSDRVHPVDISFTVAIRAVSRWGSGSKEWVAANGAGSRASGRNGTATDCEKTRSVMTQSSRLASTSSRLCGRDRHSQSLHT
jgi:uncharacterized membrane protein